MRMMKLGSLTALIAALVLCFTFGFATAQEEGGEPFDTTGDVVIDAGEEDSEPDVRYRDKTVIDFEELLLEGELKRPTGQVILERQRLRFAELIKIRKNFEPEMIRSVDKLR